MLDDRENSISIPAGASDIPEQETMQAASVVSFFSGCGGLDLGFHGDFEFKGTHFKRLPFNILKAYDFDKFCKVTYEFNLDSPFELCDLGTADVQLMPKADVLIGGFPCQEYSICGPLGGNNSKRGALFKSMSRYAKFWKPKIVVAENVPNLPRLNGGDDLKQIRQSFARAGYRSLIWNVHAPDYGVPQARDRVILLFIRSDIQINPKPPEILNSQFIRSVGWAIGDLISIEDEAIPNQSQYFKAALAKKGHGQGDEVSPKDAPGYTVRANAKSRIQFHYSLPRRLTVRECARLQTFPDSFIFPFAATRNIYQIGNAVPPVLGHAVAKTISEFLAQVGAGNLGLKK